MSRPLILVLLAVLLPGARQAPPVEYGSACPSAATAAADLIEIAQELRGERKLEAAVHCFARAADAAAREQAPLLEARARMGFARAAYDQSLYDVAQGQAARAEVLFAQAGDRLATAQMTRLLGSVALMRGDPAEARRRYERALAEFTSLAAVRERITTIVGLTRLLPRDEVSARLEEALALAREAGADDLEALALHHRSDMHFGAGRFDAAIDDLLLAIAGFEKASDLPRLATAFVSMGRIMRAHGRPQEALGYYDRALEIQAQLGEVGGRVQTLNAKAIALGHLGRKSESRAAYEQALELARQTGSPRLINFQQGNLAVVYAESGDYAEAIRLLEDVLTRERDPYILAYRHGNLARYLLATGQAERAVEHIDTAIRLATQTDNQDYLPALYQQAASIHRATRQLDAALSAAAAGIEHLERLRSRLVPLDFMKRGFSERWQLLYADTIALLYETGDHPRALATSELARARAFLDLLASRGLADRRANAFDRLGVEGPILLPSRGRASATGVAGIAATAARLDSTIVSYWVTDNEIFSWVAAPDGTVRAQRVPITRADLNALVEASVPRLGVATTEALTKLHALLIDPVRSWLPAAGRSLTIVPHGPLFRVSYAALRDASGAYLIERHPLSYAPSISTLALTAKQAASVNRNGRFVLIADPAPLPASSPRLSPLPGSRSEVSGIIRLVGHRRASLLVGARAGEALVSVAAREARVLHFATHGIIRDDAPFDSFLALGATGGAGQADDGRFTVREIYDLELKAELVVMSACSTAAGRLSGDGISGLSRALFYAGTPSVVATLWDVADAPSGRLMAAFYRYWSEGLDKRAALRRAQLALLRDLRAGSVQVKTRLGVVPLQEDPFYWAAYILVGER